MGADAALELAESQRCSIFPQISQTGEFVRRSRPDCVEMPRASLKRGVLDKGVL